MRVSLIQCTVAWEHKSANLMYFESLLSGLAGQTDLVVLPEMCTTGFSQKSRQLAETPDGETMQTFRRMAAAYGFAIAGSMIGKDLDADDAPCFNRAFFVEPDGKTTFSDKRHLFRMGEEQLHYAAGNDRTPVSYLEWNIRLAVCYDLRFPVWLRNVQNNYDLLLVVANWPQPRQAVWNTLLRARAMENQAYVCGVNRIGTDAAGLLYSGGSVLLDAYGNALAETESDIEQILTVTIEKEPLERFRSKFPVWEDADSFEIL